MKSSLKTDFELQFAVNCLAPFLLTLQLMPALDAAAPSQVIFVTSMMHKFGKLDFDSFKGWEKYSGGGSYNQSKLANDAVGLGTCRAPAGQSASR